MIATLLFLPFQSFAETNVWFTGTVKTVYPFKNGDFVITFEESSNECNSPSTPKYYYVAVGEAGVTEQGVERMLSTALTAGMGKKQLSINFNKDSTSCFINRMQINF